MNAPRGDDLERRLTELFEQRSAAVTQPPPISFDERDQKAAGPRPVRPARFGRRREYLGLIAAAAAVFMAIAGTVLGIQQWHARHNSQLAPATAALSCDAGAAPASWLRAIKAGAFEVDRTLNSVVSANGGTGDYLALQGRIYSDLVLALFHGYEGRNIYTPRGVDDIPRADPTGAISADWVTFAVTSPQDVSSSYQVMLYERRTGVTRTLAGMPQQQSEQGRSVMRPPVIAAGKVYWLTTVYAKAYNSPWPTLLETPESTRLESWDLARGTMGSPVPAAGATGLVSYGSGVALIYEGDSEATRTFGNGAGTPLTEAQLDAAASGGNFGFDGLRTLSWLKYDNRAVGYSEVPLGGAGAGRQRLIQRPAGTRVGFAPAIYPFTVAEVSGSQGLLDLRTGKAVVLPTGFSLQAVVGDEVIFGTGVTPSGAAGLSMVPLSALPPVGC